MTYRCPICSHDQSTVFVNRPGVPVHQNLLMASSNAARAVARGDLILRVCHGCGFIWNSAFQENLLQYGADYENTQSCSPAFASHMQELVSRIVDHHGVRGQTVVEVGCGKGGFISRLIDFPGANNDGYGFDPTYIGEPVAADGRLRFVNRFYDSEAASINADAVVCRHVIEHVEKPMDLLDAVRSALSASPTAKVFFETPCSEWILSNGVIWDFFYEHCSLFSQCSISYAFIRAGFHVTQVTHVFGGQYLWVEATVQAAGSASRVALTAAVSRGVPALVESALKYQQNEKSTINQWREWVVQAAKKGPLAVWGAGAKGCTFVNLVDPDSQFISAVIDLNAQKVGHFVAGTGHPIVGIEGLSERGITQAIVMNPNYLSEIRDMLVLRSLNIELVT